jgi:hypothetical protein
MQPTEDVFHHPAKQHMKTSFLLLLLSGFVLISCKEDEPVDPALVTFTGLLQEQVITTYQYGSHTISDGTTGYALTSETIELDQYIGDTVTIEGVKKDGYPVEDGPDYVEVTAVIP